MYKLIESESTVPVCYCTVKSVACANASGDGGSHSIEYLSETPTKSIRQTVTDRYIDLTSSGLLVLRFDDYESMCGLYDRVKSVVLSEDERRRRGAACKLDKIEFEHERYKNFETGKLVAVDWPRVFGAVTSLARDDSLVGATQNDVPFYATLSCALLFRAAFDCPVDYSHVTRSLQLYFKCDLEASLLASRVSACFRALPGVVCVTRGPVCVSSGRHVEHLISTSRLPLISSALEKLSSHAHDNSDAALESSLERMRLASSSSSSLSSDASAPSSSQPRPVKPSTTTASRCDGGVSKSSTRSSRASKRGESEQQRHDGIAAVYKYYKEESGALLSREKRDEIEKILCDDLPSSCLDDL